MKLTARSADPLLPSQSLSRFPLLLLPPTPTPATRAAKSPISIPSDIADFATNVLGFPLDSLQLQFLTSNAKLGILNCTRQWGKSTVSAVKALHVALTTSDAAVVVVAPTLKQSGELIRKIHSFLRRLGIPSKRVPTHPLSLALPNASRILALPSNEGSLRGYSAVDMLIIDEAARVGDEQYYAAGPMLAVRNGALWLLSTPYGERGFFWKEWAHGGSEWTRLTVIADDCPRITTEFLDRERRRLGSDWFRQEYECQFLAGEGFAFRRELLEAMVVEGLPDLFEGFDGGLN
jgi:hypothetical protein